jgi:opacity protein-like surface antigen
MTHHSRFTLATRICLLLAAFIFLSQNASLAQQTYVGRYDLYTGFSDLYTPNLNKINQVGFHLQAGINNNRWLSTGFDYSVQSGDTHLTPSLASPAVIAGLTELYDLGVLPPTYAVDIPLSATTQTFTAGSQLNYRHFSRMTLFIRPSLAAFRLSATPHPKNPYDGVVDSILVPHGSISDWTGAYGVGGGVEFALMKHIGVRAQLDAVYNHPFNYIVANGGWSYRYSIGPSFHFGRNVAPHVRKAD